MPMRRLLRRAVRQSDLLVAAFVLSLSLALAGLAINLLWRVLVNPIDVGDPERVVAVQEIESDGDLDATFTVADFTTLATAASFESVAAIGYQDAPVEAAGFSGRRPVAFVSEDLFDVLGGSVLRGRGLLALDFEFGAERVAVVSDAFWRNDLGGADDVLGREVTIGSATIKVVGIAPPGVIGIRLDAVPAAFLPMPLVRVVVQSRPQLLPEQDALQSTAAISWVTIVARLHPANTPARAEETLRSQLSSEDLGARQLSLVPLRDVAVPLTSRLELVGTTRLFLFASFAFLVLGATTLAMVALLHLESRRGEVATHLALGATRWRMVRVVADEVVLSVLLAVALALPLAGLTIGIAGGLVLPGGIEVSSLGLSLNWLTEISISILGLLSVLLVAAIVGAGVLGYTREGPPITATLMETRMVAPKLRQGLVSIIMAIAIALLGGAVFASRTASRTLEVDVGHDVSRTLSATFNLDEYRYTFAQADEFVSSLLARVRDQPGIQRASVAFMAGGMRNTLYVDGQKQEYSGFTPFLAVDRSYFDTLGIRVLVGRGFIEDDVPGQPPVAVISASTANAIAERNAVSETADLIGRTLYLGPPYEIVTIVGVVDDWVHTPSNLNGYALYLATSQHSMEAFLQSKNLENAGLGLGYSARPILTLDVDGVEDAKRAVRAAVRSLDADVEPVGMGTIEEFLRATFVLQHLAGKVMTIFSVVSVALMFISLYTLASAIGAARRQEIAIRWALGAGVRQVALWFVREMARPLIVAVLVGSTGLWVWYKVMSSYIPGLTAQDLSVVLLTLATACALAVGIAVGSNAFANCRLPASGLHRR